MQLTINDLQKFFDSNFTGSLELFFYYNDEEYVFIFYSENKKISLQKCGENLNERKYSSLEELLKREVINNIDIKKIFCEFDFYEQWNVDILKNN